MAPDFTVTSIIIPVGPYHRDICHRAYESAKEQTLPCDVLVSFDHDKRGAAWARNQGAAQARTPFLTFLDADDELEPTFVERTLRRWLELGANAYYIYSDWRLPDGRCRYAEESFDIFSMGMAHIITTLLPRAAFNAVGGFDERIGGAGEEDQDLYARLHIAGMCHARVAEPLVEYHRDLGRSATNDNNPDYAASVAAIEQRFKQKFSRYRGINMAGCCGDVVQPQGQVPLNEPFEGSVLAFAMYQPMRLTGPASGIGYKRAGLGQQMYVHKDDLAARPDLWQPVPTVEALVPPKPDVLKLAGLLS